MRLIVKVYDAQGQMIGIVPHVKSASITRILDGAGSISIEAFATDERALDLLTNERRVRIYVEEREETLREIGRGIIRNLKTSIGSGGFNLSIDGVDSLDELKRLNTLFNLAFEDEDVETVAKRLAGLAKWDAAVEYQAGNLLVDARFDGSSALKALQVLIETQDLHLRLGSAAGIVEVGRFGQEIPLRIINVETLPHEAYSNTNIAFIESISITEDTEAVANRIFVLGAGQNVDAALTLQHSSRISPYKIKWKYGPDNRKVWYIEDEDSIAKYGVIERVVSFKEIAPLANNVFSVKRASNMLYDCAKTWLRKNAYQINSFSVALKKCEQTLRPGDVVRMTFKGVVYKGDAPFTYREFNHAPFWVTKVTESVGTEGKSVRVELANIDRHPDSAARMIIGTLESISVQGVKSQPSFNQAVYGPYQKEIDSTHDVTVPLTISDATYELDLCRLRIKTTPFRATAIGAASTEIPVVTSEGGGTHRHKMFEYSGTLAPTYTPHQFAAFSSSGVGDTGFFKVDLPAQNAAAMYTASADDHSHDVTIPAHSHDLDYGIHDDTLFPGLLKITVDGVVIAENLGSSTEAIEQEFDITEIINNGTLRATHNILIECGETDSQGMVEVEFELFTTILPQHTLAELISGGSSSSGSGGSSSSGSGGGSGVSSLDDLSDVAIVSPADDDVLVYTGGGWVNSPGIIDGKLLVTSADTTPDHLAGKVTSGTGIALTTLLPGGDEVLQIAVDQNQLSLVNLGTRVLDNLSDVVITAAATNDALYYNGSSWVNGKINVLKTGDTMTGPLSIQGSSDTIQAIVQAHSSQTTEIQEWRNGSGTAIAQMNYLGGIRIQQAAVATPGLTARSFTVVSAAHTNMGASTERPEVIFNLSATQQFATGALALQRALRVLAPTYSFVGASTLTNAVTVDIDGAPIVGTNATFTNRIGLRVGDRVQINGTLDIVPTASTGSPLKSILLTAPAHTSLSAAEYIDVHLNLARNVQFSTGGTIADQRAIYIDRPTYTATSATQTITNATTLYLVGAPVQSTNVTITNSRTLWVASGVTRLDGQVQINELVVMGDSGYNFQFGTGTGTKFGTSTSDKMALWNKTPIVRPTALTTALTTVTCSAPGTPDYAIANLTAGSFGFTTLDEGLTVIKVIANLQTRVNELETRLSNFGFLP